MLDDVLCARRHVRRRNRGWGANSCELRNGVADTLGGDSLADKKTCGGRVALLGESDQNMLGADVGMPELTCRRKGSAERALRPLCETIDHKRTALRGEIGSPTFVRIGRQGLRASV